jgi:hypothetical protein
MGFNFGAAFGAAATSALDTYHKLSEEKYLKEVRAAEKRKRDEQERLAKELGNLPSNNDVNTGVAPSDGVAEADFKQQYEYDPNAKVDYGGFVTATRRAPVAQAVAPAADGAAPPAQSAAIPVDAAPPAQPVAMPADAAPSAQPSAMPAAAAPPAQPVVVPASTAPSASAAAPAQTAALPESGSPAGGESASPQRFYKLRDAQGNTVYSANPTRYSQEDIDLRRIAIMKSARDPEMALRGIQAEQAFLQTNYQRLELESKAINTQLGLANTAEDLQNVINKHASNGSTLFPSDVRIKFTEAGKNDKGEQLYVPTYMNAQTGRVGLTQRPMTLDEYKDSVRMQTADGISYLQARGNMETGVVQRNHLAKETELLDQQLSDLKTLSPLKVKEIQANIDHLAAQNKYTAAQASYLKSLVGSAASKNAIEAKIAALDPKSPTYQDDLANLNNQRAALEGKLPDGKITLGAMGEIYLSDGNGKVTGTFDPRVGKVVPLGMDLPAIAAREPLVANGTIRFGNDSKGNPGWEVGGERFGPWELDKAKKRAAETDAQPAPVAAAPAQGGQASAIPPPQAFVDNKSLTNDQLYRKLTSEVDTSGGMTPLATNLLAALQMRGDPRVKATTRVIGRGVHSTTAFDQYVTNAGKKKKDQEDEARRNQSNAATAAIVGS